MTYITFSQTKLKSNWNDRIRRILEIVKTKATPDLWIKVFIYRDKTREFNGELKTYKATGYRGHYRWVEAHGFYDEEWKFIRKHPKVKHCITLKLGESNTDEDIAHLIAHEFRHYLQYSKYGNGMVARRNGGHRVIQVEKDAEEWEEKRINQLIGERKIKHKDKNNGFLFWKFQQTFEEMFK